MPVVEQASGATQVANEQMEPALRPGLLVDIEVSSAGKKEVDEPAKRVSATGALALPLIGSVKVAGMTLDELSALLKEKYSLYLRDPMVDVQFVFDKDTDSLSPWGFVTVLGRVKKPGRITIPPTQDLSLSMAIQLAGGLDTSAKETDIKVRRKADGGQAESFEVDLRAVGAGGDSAGDLRLKAGDVVYVPERVF